jgi:hypothetical protein
MPQEKIGEKVKAEPRTRVKIVPRPGESATQGQ